MENKLINIIKQKIKPSLINYSTTQLECLIKEYDNEIVLKKINLNIKNKQRNELEKIIYDLWRENIITDDENSIIDCSICLQPIINSDNIILECEHILHSSCLINYIFSNITSTIIDYNLSHYTNRDKINNTFKCPKCRNYLTKFVEEKIHNEKIKNEEIFNGEILNNSNSLTSNYNYLIENNNDNDLGVDLLTGFWISNNNSNLVNNDSRQLINSNLLDNIIIMSEIDNYNYELNSNNSSISDDSNISI